VDFEETVINIEKGRHPVIPLLFSADDQFIANDTKLKVCHKFSECEVFLYPEQSNFVKV
jgi:DNA mismatch repair ATPase MutS